MICYKCGTFNEDGSAFCYKCGNSLMANGANSSMQGVGVGSGMAANGMQPNGMQPNGMQPNGMYNPGMSGNGMYPGMSGNGYAPIKPKKSYTWLIILIAVLSIIAIGAVSVVLIFFVGNSDDDKVEKSEEKTTIVSEATTEDGTKEVVEDETENATEEKTEDETEVATEDDIEETTEDQNTEYETISIYSDLYEELVGGWDAPGDGSDVDGGAYWEFRNGEYWWYKTKDDLTDNYWYGTTEIIVGTEGVKMAGLNYEAIDYIVSSSGGKVSEDSIYTIICTPKTIISGGVDKSATNIPEGTTLIYVWVLVDNGEDGIQAQTIRLSDYSIYYYNKVTD